MSLTTGKKKVHHKFTEMPMTQSVIRQVLKWAGKDRALTGLNFLNKYGVEYNMDEEEDEGGLLAREEKMAPFPDVLAEAPGMMTEYEKILDGDNVIKEELITDDIERAALAAENSVLEFRPVEAREGRQEMINLLDNYDYEEVALIGGIKNDIVVKQEVNDMEKMVNDSNKETEQIVDQPTRSGRVRIANKQYEDYELYTTVGEEENLLLV